MSFTVATTGNTDAIRVPNAPSCIQDALTAWERSLQLDPNADGVKKKIEELRDRLGRVKGERSKLSP